MTAPLQADCPSVLPHLFCIVSPFVRRVSQNALTQYIRPLGRNKSSNLEPSAFSRKRIAESQSFDLSSTKSSISLSSAKVSGNLVTNFFNVLGERTICIWYSDCYPFTLFNLHAQIISDTPLKILQNYSSICTQPLIQSSA